VKVTASNTLRKKYKDTYEQSTPNTGTSVAQRAESVKIAGCEGNSRDCEYDGKSSENNLSNLKYCSH